MVKNINKISVVIIGTLLLLIGFVVLSGKNTPQTPLTIPSPTASHENKSQTDHINYDGKNGIDALTILEEIAEVEKGQSGLVVSINGRGADNSEKEFWAFYVNGEMAQVGPADYETKDTDRIEWKIETY